MVDYKSDKEYNNPLCWDATYEIVLALSAHYADVNIDEVGLQQLRAMILALPGFEDDPELAHDGLLSDILREWYEEAQDD